MSSFPLLAQSAPSASWFEQLLNHRDFMGVVVFVFVSVIVIVPVLAGVWYRLRVREWETSLKYSMLERGMSAEEIRTVLNAGSLRGEPAADLHRSAR